MHMNKYGSELLFSVITFLSQFVTQVNLYGGCLVYMPVSLET